MAMIYKTHVNFVFDNRSVCFIINKQSCKNKQVMLILRRQLLLVKYNIHLYANNVPGKLNTLTDSISRFQVTSKELALQVSSHKLTASQVSYKLTFQAHLPCLQLNYTMMYGIFFL